MMTILNIDADGIYDVTADIPRATTTGIKSSGAAGGALMTLNYKNSSGAYIQYENGTITTGQQQIINHGSGGSRLWLAVSSASASTNIEIEVTAL